MIDDLSRNKKKKNTLKFILRSNDISFLPRVKQKMSNLELGNRAAFTVLPVLMTSFRSEGIPVEGEQPETC